MAIDHDHCVDVSVARMLMDGGERVLEALDEADALLAAAEARIEQLMAANEQLKADALTYAINWHTTCPHDGPFDTCGAGSCANTRRLLALCAGDAEKEDEHARETADKATGSSASTRGRTVLGEG